MNCLIFFSEHKKGENMRKTLPLPEIGRRLKMIDRHMIGLLAKRMELGREVERTKRENNDPLLRLTVENERLAAARTWAENEGIEPNFAQAILYFVISETCREEIKQLQGKTDLEPISLEQQRENLLALTEQIAPEYDATYGNDFFATGSYLKFEAGIIKREIDTLRSLGNLDLAIDLGCATGKVAFKLAECFKQAKGYDISPAMIERARIKCQTENGSWGNIEFSVADIEEGIPEATRSASFAVMNFGTASDVVDIRRVLAAIKRVLKPDGRFLLSFYNAGSLLNKCWFVPWPVSLVARVNALEHCLDVRLKDKVFSIPARPYTVKEIKKILRQNGLANFQIVTYPTVSSILPRAFFEEEGMKQFVEEIDHQLINLDTGAYILVTGRAAS